MGKVYILVNRKAGTVRDRGPGLVAGQLRAAADEVGWDAEIEMLHPASIAPRIEQLARKRPAPRAIIVGGGDGTLSTAAGLLAGKKTALGVLPLGTMNLFARAHGVPLDPIAAIKALAVSKPGAIDLLDINGHTVLQHATLGLMATVIRIRESLPYSSRIRRLANGVVAWVKAVRRPRALRVTARSKGMNISRSASAMLISNNRLPEEIGATPVARDMTRGEIGVYICTSRRRADVIRLTLAASLGVWRNTTLVEEFVVGELDVETSRSPVRLVIDGELVRLTSPLKCCLRRKSLRLLAPGDAKGNKN
ncbi:MAG: diacylglycerol kinase family protein [Hyphomicrobiales bacterium]